MKVRQHLLKFISPKVPVETRRKVASALASGTPSEVGAVEGLERLTPADVLTVLFILGFDPDSGTSKEAVAGLTSFSPERLASALEERLDPRLLKRLASLHIRNPSVLALIRANPGADAGVKGASALTRERADGGGALSGAAKKEAVKPVAPEEKRAGGVPEEEEEVSIYQMVQSLNTAEKIKLGLTGGKTERGLLINDANKVVASAVLKNPRVTDSEILAVVNSKNASEEVLRMVVRNKNWMKNSGVRLGLIKNPKTPLPIAMRLLDYIDKRELARLAKSKNISSVLASNALRKMQRIR